MGSTEKKFQSLFQFFENPQSRSGLNVDIGTKVILHSLELHWRPFLQPFLKKNGGFLDGIIVGVRIMKISQKNQLFCFSIF